MTVICLTGAPGAGKSTIGSLLAERGAAGVHVQVDFFRKQVRAGYASPHHWDDEVERQYHLARRAAAATVRIYAEVGFVVVVDDIIPIEVVPAWQDLLAGLDPLFVLLAPPLEVALDRNRARSVWTVDPAIVRSLHESLARAADRPGWLVLDTAQLDLEAAVDLILAAAEARSG